MINLLAFWLGGTAAAVGFGLVTLNLLRNSLPAFVHDMSSVLSGITGGHVKIVIGVLALLVTAVTAVRLARQRERAPLGSGALRALVPQPATPTAIHRLVARVRRLLEGGNPWVGFVAGLNRDAVGRLPDGTLCHRRLGRRTRHTTLRGSKVHCGDCCACRVSTRLLHFEAQSKPKRPSKPKRWCCPCTTGCGRTVGESSPSAPRCSGRHGGQWPVRYVK